MVAVTRGDERRSIERELKRGSLELIVLHLLSPGEAYGYEIVSKLTEQTNGSLEVTDGTLYPVLYRLERAGYVAVRWETPERGVPRKYLPADRRGAGRTGRAARRVDNVRESDGEAAQTVSESGFGVRELATSAAVGPRATA